MNRLSRLAIIGIVGGSCVGCDQVTKVIAHRQLEGQGSISVLGGMIRLSYVENPGAFLSLGGSLSPEARFWVLGVAVGLGLVILAAYAIGDRRVSVAEVLAIAMMIGGGAGNLIDRVTYGVVRDFLNLGVSHLRTGIFNVADMAVTLGAVIFLAGSWRGWARGDRPSAS